MLAALKQIKRQLSGLRLSPTATAVRDEHLTYLSPTKLDRIERTLDRVLKVGVPGDVLEFGVALGGSAILLAGRARKAHRRFAGFNVFAMIPPPTSDKDDAKSKERYEIISSGKSEGIAGDPYYGYREDLYGDVCKAFARHGVPVDGEQVQLVKGLFEETWPTFQTSGVCFAHLDCDWYDPVRYCLSMLRNKLAVGGAIILDDYHDYGGCKVATDEFLAQNSQFALKDGANAILVRQH